MIQAEAETQYSENAYFYDGFLVPEHSRWTYLQTRLVLDRFKLAGVIATR